MGFTPSTISRLSLPYSHCTSIPAIKHAAGIIVDHLKAPLRAKKILKRGIAVVQTKHTSIASALHTFKRVGYELPEEEPTCD